MPIELRAYPVGATEGFTIIPAGPRREWMDQTPNRFAYHCLPLSMANQAGWFVTCPATFSVVWNGTNGIDGLRIRFDEGDEGFGKLIRSHFGSGVLSFAVPWLFRTSPGYGLWVRGPANWVREDAWPLEGLVETDWAPYTFTMNWKILRRNTPTWFRKGEPFCMLTPYPLDLLETVEPAFASLEDNPELAEDHRRFGEGRRERFERAIESRAPSGAEAADSETPAPTPIRKLDYLRGRLPDGTVVDQHRTNFKLSRFE